MFFEEYSEFIEALYCVRYSKRNEEEKLNRYKEIYNDYIKFGEVNKDFEEIYNDIITGVVYTLKACDLEFLRVYNGLLLSISKLLRLKVKIHYLEESTYIDKVYVVQGEERNYHCLQCDNKNQKLFFSYEAEGIKITYCKRCLEFGRCFVCNSVFISNNDRIKTVIRPIGPPDMSSMKVSHLNHPYWTYELFKSFPEYDKEGVDYLCKKRHYLLESLYSPLGIRFSGHNPVIPFFFKGEMIYYQIRLIDGESRIKYFSPPIDHKPAYIIEKKENKNIIICEGVFDAIACLILYPNYTPFAVLGSSITDYQIWMLRSYIPDKIKIFMDKTELSVGIKERIRNFVNYADIGIVPSDGRDPEETLINKLLLGNIHGS